MNAQKAAAIGVILFILSGVYFVAPNEEAVVRSFGKVIGITGPGMHYRLPFPITKVDKLRVREVRRVSIGADAPDAVLGRASGGRAEFLSADQNIVHLQLTVQFTVADPRAYLFFTGEPDELMRNAATAALSRVVNSKLIDTVMTTGKADLVALARKELDELILESGIGITVRALSLERTAPPAEVAEAFRDVTNAREDRERLVNEADGYRRAAEPEARGEAQSMLAEAQGYRERKVNEAKGDADRFRKMLSEYRNAKDVTSRRLYLEAMEEILPKIRKVVLDSAGGKAPVDFGIFKAQ